MLFSRPAERPSRYLKDDPQDQSTNAKPVGEKENVEMSVKELVDSKIKNDKVLIW